MERAAALRPVGIMPTVTLFGAATAAGCDWLALLSGVVFAYGSLRVYEAPDVSAAAQTTSTMLGCALVSGLVLLLLPAELAGSVPALSTGLLLSVGAYALAMIIPINWLWL